VTIHNSPMFDRSAIPDTVRLSTHPDGRRGLTIATAPSTFIVFICDGPDDLNAMSDYINRAAIMWREDIRKDHPAADRAMPVHGPAMLGDVA
jgi:hypothetical protein